MCTITHSDAFLALQAELATERKWREELADLSVDQQREIERLKIEVERLNRLYDDVYVENQRLHAEQASQS